MPEGIYGEGTIITPDGLTKYLGNALADRNVLQEGSRLSVNEFGADVLYRKYKVKLALLKDFEPQPGLRDFRWEELKYWEHEITEGTTHAIISVKFNGFRNGRAPRIYRPEYDSQYQEITISNGQAQVTLVYISPSVTVRYASPTRPKDDEKFAMEPDLCRVSHVKTATTITLADIATSTHDAIEMYGIKRKTERPTFTRVKEGEIWMCTEVIHSIFVQQTIDFPV